MRYIGKLLVASGLVILTSPLCFTTMAQDYVDLEAERAAGQSSQTAAPGSSDPYSVKPAQTYPATSYGVNRPAAPSAAAAGQSPGQNLGMLLSQVQELQQEVMRLNGMVEEQAYELRKLKEQSQQRYLDLDRRLGGTAAAGAGLAAGSAAAPSAAATPQPAPAPVSAAPAAEQPGEAEAYKAAYALVRGQQYDQSVQAFQQFLRDYPDGRYAPNAHYWLGEVYLVLQPPNLEESRQAFTLLLSLYPDNSKAPDALYKLGKVYYQKGNPEKAREYMDRVIKDYGDSNTGAVQLARDFLDENY